MVENSVEWQPGILDRRNPPAQRISIEELRAIHQTTKDVMGDVVPEMEWRSNT